MKRFFVIIASVFSLFLIGCTNDSDVDAASLNDVDPSSVDEESAEKREEEESENAQGIQIGYEYQWEDTERELFSLETQLDEEDYQNIGLFFQTFELQMRED